MGPTGFKGMPKVAPVVKNPPANAGDTRDVGLIPGLGRYPEEEMATHSSILAWKTPWTEELGGIHTVHEVTKSRTQLKTRSQEVSDTSSIP